MEQAVSAVGTAGERSGNPDTWAIAAATLALAEQQKAANLIALIVSNRWSDSVVLKDAHAQVLEILDLT